MQTIQKDEFLNENHIQIERNSYLANHYARKSFSLRQSYNPRDPYGTRLSHFWQPGDTIWSVIFKRITHNTKRILNPDTYTRESAIKGRNFVLKYKLEIMGIFITIAVPIFMIYPMIRPSLKKIKRDMLFQYYVQSQTIARKLQTKSEKLSITEMQEIIRKSEAKIKL